MSGGIKMGNNRFDLLSLGEILLRLSPPDNERIVSGETFQKQVGGAELNVVSGVSILGLRTGVVSKLPDNVLFGKLNAALSVRLKRVFQST